MISLRSFFSIVLILILFTSCSGKKSPEGIREPVFTYFDDLKVDFSKKSDLKTPDVKSTKNYYGNNSILNKRVENYYINQDLTKKRIKKKKYKLGKKRRIFQNKHFIPTNPVIVDDVLYNVSSNGFLYARNMKKIKKPLWKIKIVKWKRLKELFYVKISSTENKELVLLNNLGEIKLISLGKKEIIWSKNISSIPISNPIINKDTIYFITNNNQLYALNKSDGKIKWIHSGIEKNTAILGVANPVIYENMVFASYSSGELYAIEQKTGNTIWSETLIQKVNNFNKLKTSDIDATPIIKDDKIYAVSNAGVLAALELQTGKKIWKKNFASITNYWLVDKFIFVINNNNILVSIDIKNGAVQWTKEFQKFKKEKKKKKPIVYRSLIMGDGNLLVFNSKKQLLVTSPKNGETIRTFKLRHNITDIPFVVYGKLYLTTLKGRKIRLMGI